MQSDDPLPRLLSYLKQADYAFTAVTPATHAEMLSRPPPPQPGLREVFGWNRPFAEKNLDPALFALMADCGILERCEGGHRSALRVASLGDDLFLHSSFPTEDSDAVFFGPDTYRFATFIKQHLSGLAAREVVDMGAGSGAGGIVVARLAPSASITLVDTNPRALALARINARFAQIEVETLASSCLPAACDLVIANPPYMMDDSARAYRDGGKLLGGELSLAWARDALGRLVPGGTMLLYTGAVYVDGNAPLLAELRQLCLGAGASLAIEEIDPDVFGDELAKPAYAEVERIAAIGCVLRTPT